MTNAVFAYAFLGNYFILRHVEKDRTKNLVIHELNLSQFSPYCGVSSLEQFLVYFLSETLPFSSVLGTRRNSFK